MLEQSIPAYAGWAWAFLWLSVRGRPSRLAALLWVSLLFLFNACHLSLTFVVGMGLLLDFMWQAEAFWSYFRCRHSCRRVTALSATSQPGRHQFEFWASNQIFRKGHFTLWKLQSKQSFSLGSKRISDYLNWNSKEDGRVSGSSSFNEWTSGKSTENKCDGISKSSLWHQIRIDLLTSWECQSQTFSTYHPQTVLPCRLNGFHRLVWIHIHVLISVCFSFISSVQRHLLQH